MYETNMYDRTVGESEKIPSIKRENSVGRVVSTHEKVPLCDVTLQQQVKKSHSFVSGCTCYCNHVTCLKGCMFLPS